MRISDWSSDVCSSDLDAEQEMVQTLLREKPSVRRDHLNEEGPRHDEVTIEELVGVLSFLRIVQGAILAGSVVEGLADAGVVFAKAQAIGIENGGFDRQDGLAANDAVAEHHGVEIEHFFQWSVRRHDRSEEHTSELQELMRI